jgi:lipopolysaccharide transport system permease protein
MTASSAADLRDDLLQPSAPITDEELELEDYEREALAMPVWQPTLRERIREAWQSRYLLPGLGRSAVPTYSGRILGRAWHLIRPLWQIFGMALIFGGIFHAKVPNGIPYLLYVVFSYQAFQLFRITLMYETVGSKLVKVMRNLRVPQLLLPFAILNRVFVRLIVYWAVAILVLLYYLIAHHHLYVKFDQHLIVGFVGVVSALAFGMALGLITGTIYGRAKDIKYFVRFLTPILVFLTPVYYSTSALPGWAQTVAQFNPLAGIVNMVQYGFLGAVKFQPFAVAWFFGTFVVTSVFGLWFFNKFATKWLGIYRVPDDTEDDDDEVF